MTYASKFNSLYTSFFDEINFTALVFNKKKIHLKRKNAEE
jgi:hypothetical protein